MKRFGIIKRAYIWVILAVCLALGWGFIFLMNANYSEEFTGWVSISINTQTNAEEIQNSLSNFLAEPWKKGAFDVGAPPVHRLRREGSQSSLTPYLGQAPSFRLV